MKGSPDTLSQDTKLFQETVRSKILNVLHRVEPQLSGLYQFNFASNKKKSDFWKKGWKQGAFNGMIIDAEN
jgi:hypothetical protein